MANPTSQKADIVGPWTSARPAPLQDEGPELLTATTEEIRARLRRRYRARFAFFAAALGFFLAGIVAFATRDTETIPFEWLIVLQFLLWTMAAACLLYLSNVPCPACGKPFHATRDPGTHIRSSFTSSCFNCGVKLR